jgi:uncharacterized protein YbcI
MTNGTKPALKTQGELEAAISIGLCRVEQEHMGRGPKDVSAYVLGDMVVVRLTGVLTEAEKHLARSHPVANGRDLLKQVRAQIVETARPALESMIEAVTGVKVISLHHDISTATGEKVVVFTLAQPPIMRQAKHK